MANVQNDVHDIPMGQEHLEKTCTAEEGQQDAKVTSPVSGGTSACGSHKGSFKSMTLQQNWDRQSRVEAVNDLT